MSTYYGQPQQPPVYGGAYQPQSQPAGWSQPQPAGWNQGVPVYGGGDPNIEGGIPKRDIGFTDKTIRAAFVRKVFTMVSIMLGVVTIMTAIPFLHQPTKDFVRHSQGGYGLYLASYFTFIVIYIALMCCESVRRSFPSNLICSGILTLAIGYMTMMITAYHSIESVLLCLAITTICCVGIILFSMQTKIDFTNFLGFACIAGLVLFVFGIIAIMSMAIFHIRWMYTVYAGLAALLIMLYLAIDIQMLMGGRKIELSPEEHIFAAIQIFMDIVQIFWMLLMLFGDRD